MPLSNCKNKTRCNNIDQAKWILFLSSLIAENDGENWDLFEAIYYRLNNDDNWDWKNILNSFVDFKKWIVENHKTLSQKGRMGIIYKCTAFDQSKSENFVKHIEEYLDWVKEENRLNNKDTVHPDKCFNESFTSMSAKLSCDPLVIFNFLSILVGFGIIKNKPTQFYFQEINLAKKGVKWLLYSEEKNNKITIEFLNDKMLSLAKYLDIQFPIYSLQQVL